MRQETFAILFLMRKGRPKKNGLAPIFARITTGGLRQEVYTQCDSNPETWNQHKERAMGTNKLAIQVNERLNDFRVKIIDIRTKLLAEGYAANAAQIKQRYLNPTCNTMMLIAGLADYAKRRQGEVGVRITQRTADKYERLLRYLKQYLAQRGKAEDIPVERMNYEFLDGFNLFLQTAHRCRHNGAVAVMDCLRNFVLYCLRNEWITKNPFRYYKLKEDEVQAKEHLTAHELELLTRKELDHRLARIRDVFVFCCLTGFCYCDMRALTEENLVKAEDGSLWIHTERQKTGTPECIRLMEIPLAILKKYEGMDASGKLLPMLTKESMNRHLKKMSVMCGINRPISFHQARHTFGSIICLSQGIPIETVSKIMGHKHIKTTQRYAKVTQDKIDRDVDRLGEAIEGKFSLFGLDAAPSPIHKDITRRRVNPSWKQRAIVKQMMEG